jgi:transcriptional repressor NrdR
MRCPKCGQLEDKVLDSRETKNGAVIRRRRQCLRCQHRFTTYEEVQREGWWVIKRDGRREKFDRNKLRGGIEKACEKRPVSHEQVELEVEEIMNEIEKEYDREVPATALGEKVMKRLRRMDEVAYVRFASVYRQFRDIREFTDEIQNLESKR